MGRQLIKSLSDLSADAIAEFHKALKAPIPPEQLGDLQKAITQSTGLTFYDLQAPAKNLFPVLTPLRNRTPRVSGRGGTATNWKAVTAININSLRGFVPEGFRNGVVGTTVADKAANYKSLGLEDSVTFEAELAARGFEDVRATTAQRLMWATMIEEEVSILGADNSVALGIPTAPTLVIVDGGGTVADGTYNVIVVALTMHGYLASSLSGGVPGSVTVTTADGDSFSYGGGSSQKSAATSTGAIANGDDSSIQMSTPVVPGAVAYAWFVGVAASERLQAITLINSAEVTALSGTSQLISTTFDSDNSQNTYAYDGILYQAWTSGSNAYIANLATGTPGVGTGLTADTAGGITEIDVMLQSLWDNYRISPTTLWVNAQEMKNITSKILASSGANYQLMSPSTTPELQRLIGGGMYLSRYLNKFAMSGGQLIDVEIHPNMPPGTLSAVTEILPYPLANVENVMEVRFRRDYYQMEWPLRTRKYETGVYVDSVFAHYFPPSIGIITNIADA